MFKRLLVDEGAFVVIRSVSVELDVLSVGTVVDDKVLVGWDCFLIVGPVDTVSAVLESVLPAGRANAEAVAQNLEGRVRFNFLFHFNPNFFLPVRVISRKYGTFQTWQ